MGKATQFQATAFPYWMLASDSQSLFHHGRGSDHEDGPARGVVRVKASAKQSAGKIDKAQMPQWPRESRMRDIQVVCRADLRALGTALFVGGTDAGKGPTAAGDGSNRPAEDADADAN